jgi:hypothetical protein
MATDDEINAAWSARGYQPQIFPYYNFAGSVRFLDGNGEPNAIAGSKANLTFSIDSFPIMLIGVRFETIWPVVEDPTDSEVRLYQMVTEVVDPAYTIDVKLSSQSIVGKPIPVSSLQGRGGLVWHNFPSPYAMAGSNSFDFDLARLTSYPKVRGERIVPTVNVTLVTQQLRADRVTVATHRRMMPGT